MELAQGYSTAAVDPPPWRACFVSAFLEVEAIEKDLDSAVGEDIEEPGEYIQESVTEGVHSSLQASATSTATALLAGTG